MEREDIIFQREMKRMRLAAKYPIKPGSRLPLKPRVKEKYKNGKIPLAVDIRVSLRDAAMQKKMVKINYKKVSGEVKQYQVEPYSFRYLRLNQGVRKVLFAYDEKEKKIKSFVMKNILKIEIVNRKFSPRWPIEIGKRQLRTSVHKPGR